MGRPRALLGTMRLFVRATAFVASIGLGSVAVAQSPSSSSAPATAPNGSTAVPSADADSTTPAASAPPSAPVVPATGYSYGAVRSVSASPQVPRSQPRPARSSGAGPDAVMPGFETLADGSTRLFVDLSKPATYDTKQGRSAITYVLKGVRVDRRNNQNPLVTIHFNTPVTSARLVPHGRDLWFVVDLRAIVLPTTTMDADKDGAATLHVAFPKGDYLPSHPTGSLSSTASSDASRASSPQSGAPPNPSADLARPVP
jgi:hypothetical protein